jgi:hypothetical protein
MRPAGMTRPGPRLELRGLAGASIMQVIRAVKGLGWSGGWCLVVARGPDLVFGPTGLLAAEGGDGVGAVDGPVHARSL